MPAPVERQQRHQQEVRRITGRRSGRKVPNRSGSSTSPGRHSRKISGLPRFGVTGSTIGWPRSCSASSNGRMSISCPIGQKPDTTAPAGGGTSRSTCSRQRQRRQRRIPRLARRQHALAHAPAWPRSSSARKCAEPPWPLASQSSQGLRVAGGRQIPRPGSRQSQLPGGCLLAPGMNCLTHRAAPPVAT